MGPEGLPYRFELDGDEYTIAEDCDVADAVSRGDWMSIVPHGLDEESFGRIMLRLVDHDDGVELLSMWRAVLGVAEDLLGQPWHVAVRALSAAATSWTWFDAWCVQQGGFDPQVAAPHRVLAAALGWLQSCCEDDKAWTQMQARLFAPPPHAGFLAKAGLPMWTADDEAELAERALAAMGR